MVQTLCDRRQRQTSRRLVSGDSLKFSEIRKPSTQKISPAAASATIKLTPSVARNFFIREQILQLRRRFQTNRLKNVSRPPMPQGDLVANFVRVKKFAVRFRRADA